MLIGAHVSTVGGLTSAIERGVDRGCHSIQIVNQSPRVWRPNNYSEEDCRAFNRARAATDIEAVAIHTSYLLNCATRDDSIRWKSLHSLIHALRLGDAIDSIGIVVHPGSQKDDDLDACMRRVAEVFVEALDESDESKILLEHAAGYRGAIGRNFDQLARLIELAGEDPRIGICLDTCHLFAQGYDVRREDGLNALLDEVDRKIGIERLACLHINDAMAPIGTRKDRHANVGEGMIGAQGLATVLGSERLEGLAAILETPGPDKKGPDAREVRRAHEIRAMALSARNNGHARRGRSGGLIARLLPT